MVEFINRTTGGVMWVADDRVGEYIAAGHKPAASLSPEKPADALRETAAKLKETVKKVQEEPTKTKKTVTRRTKKDGNGK